MHLTVLNSWSFASFALSMFAKTLHVRCKLRQIVDVRSYVPPVKIGEVMRGQAVGVIIASKSSKLPVGSYAVATAGWTELAVLNEKEVERVDIPKNGKMTDALGVLGMTGMTAYFGLLRVGQVKAGDFVVVSGAAGATGSIVGQIAKLKGAKVLGIAGSDDKCEWLKQELGFDEALNYKDKAFAKRFRDVTRKGIDVFFDNGKYIYLIDVVGTILGTKT
jgi:NADPH-dependent curcumin reductase CurA